MTTTDTPPQLAVSIVVPTYNRRKGLERALRALSQQDVDGDFEVIVVSDGSTDDTDDYLAHHGLDLELVCVRQSNQGPGAARNAGVAHARADLVLFVDDDVSAAPSLVRTHLEAHRRHGDRAVVIGPMFDPPDHTMSPWVEWEQAMLAKQYAAMDRGDYRAGPMQFFTGNASVRTSHLREAGGFRTDLFRAEDIELAFRLSDLGLEFHYERSAAGYHYASRPFESWQRMADSYGRNAVKFARDLHRTWLYGFMRDGYQKQHRAIRALVRSTSWPPSRRFVTRSLTTVLPVSVRCGPSSGTRYILSALYALEYYNGVTEELGSTQAFRRMIASGSPEMDRVSASEFSN